MTSPTPSPRWAAGDKAMVVLKNRNVLGSGNYFAIQSDRHSEELHVSALHPLPSATAEDEAVLRLADAWCDKALKTNNGLVPDWASEESKALVAAIRSRRAAQDGAQGAETKDSAPAIEAAREAVCAEFLKLLTPDGNLKLAVQPYSNAYPAVAALVALRALLTPQPPPDPVAQLARTTEMLEKAYSCARVQYNAAEEAEGRDPHRQSISPGSLFDEIEKCIAEARTALAALEREGWVLAPKEATAEMAVAALDFVLPKGWKDVSGFEERVERVRGCTTAAISARPAIVPAQEV